MRRKKNISGKNYIFIQLIAPCIMLSIAFVSCTDKSAIDQVTPDTYFTDLFHRSGDGFTGGDGTYSVELPDGRTVWIFGDTFLGEVEEDGSRKKSDPIYIRNSFVVQDGNDLATIYQKINGHDHSAVIPPRVLESGFEIPETEVWFWPGDGLIENDELKVFMSEFIQTDTGMWGFAWQATALVSFSLPDMQQNSIQYIEHSNEVEIHYGHAVLEDTDYTYIYGLGNGKPYVARAATGHVAGSWEFFTGEEWSSDSRKSLPMADMAGSEQFSVFKEQGIYILVNQLSNLSSMICSYTSDQPFTGWENKKDLYKTPLPENNKNLFTYNALAHPQFKKKNSLLISYNTNSYVLEDHFKDAGIYRPRFIRVPYSLIHSEFK